MCVRVVCGISWNYSGCALIGDVRGQQLELFMNCKRNLAFIFYTHSFVYPPPSKFIHMLFLTFFLLDTKWIFNTKCGSVQIGIVTIFHVSYRSTFIQLIYTFI